MQLYISLKKSLRFCFIKKGKCKLVMKFKNQYYGNTEKLFFKGKDKENKIPDP